MSITIPSFTIPLGHVTGESLVTIEVPGDNHHRMIDVREEVVHDHLIIDAADVHPLLQEEGREY